MASKKSTAASDDLLGGAPGDDLLGGDPAEAKPARKTKAKAKPAEAAPAAEAKPARKTKAKAAEAAEPEAKPARKPKARAAAAEGDRTPRGQGKFYYAMEEKAALAKRISGLKKPMSMTELAEKFEVETWQARRAVNEILVKEGKGTCEKVGTTLVYTPA